MKQNIKLIIKSYLIATIIVLDLVYTIYIISHLK